MEREAECIGFIAAGVIETEQENRPAATSYLRIVASIMAQKRHHKARCRSPVPTPLRHLGGRRFSFYPPIRNIEHNEWLYRRETWSECVVANLRTGEEICVPRMFLGEVSIVDDPVIIVGLSRELEWRDGAIIPHVRRVIELPVAVNAVNDFRAAPARHARPAPVINRRLEPKQERRTGKTGAFTLLGVVALSIVAGITEGRTQLNATDDWSSVTGKLGKPASDDMRTVNGRVYRVSRAGIFRSCSRARRPRPHTMWARSSKTHRNFRNSRGQLPRLFLRQLLPIPGDVEDADRLLCFRVYEDDFDVSATLLEISDATSWRRPGRSCVTSSIRVAEGEALLSKLARAAASVWASGFTRGLRARSCSMPISPSMARVTVRVTWRLSSGFCSRFRAGSA